MKRHITILKSSIALCSIPATASYSFYVGSNLTASGAVLVGGTGEEVSSHWLKIYSAADHAANETVTVGVTSAAVVPGKLTTIPQVRHTFKYISMDYSDYLGFPPPISNGGVNEKGVAVRDVWAPGRAELLDMTPKPQKGPSYSDLARLVMERASSAREGVQIIGELIGKYGYSDYGGNTHLIADKDEGWIVWEFAGGKGLWAAERLGPNDVRVNDPNYMASDNIVSFAVNQGWWSHESGKPFNIKSIYGLQPGQETPAGGDAEYMSPDRLEKLTKAMVPVTEKDLIERVRDPRISNDEAGYGQVVSLHPDTDPDMYRIWIAPTSSVAAPFIPWWLGAESIPPELGEHRYLSKDAESTFLNPDYELQEASLFAGRLFKRVLYYMCSAPRTYLPIVKRAFIGFEDQSRKDIEWVEKSAKFMIVNGERNATRRLLTHYSHTRANRALDMGKAMVNALDS
ncbi:hypothetical protein N7509_000798 [Penicillium cosmopolitanum]|uniref:Dipeptidase n=1 Tax=Penicillium cosmopolitanum TaxID=1131564 RepID=A0A9W9WAY4_9EURO|nr:uncharacterized protein N7509_000798 [Penicillium cosmopolitanum]KAJ5414171.1 hypothetical protein N7509_000798 [Penicillium cosmopolitanum]